MVERVSALREAFALKAWARSITCGDNGGTVQPINSKSSTPDGWKPFVCILDELPAHKDRGLFDVSRRSEEHTSQLRSLLRTSYFVFRSKKILQYCHISPRESARLSTVVFR